MDLAQRPALYDETGRPLGPAGLAFTDEQTEAILRREGPMLLSANAGSGKTAVLAERFVRAVLEDDLAPGRLLAITFTEKAAGELRARVRRRFVELGARDAARDMDGAWISTIHGFCARVLRAQAVTAGLDPAFVVLDEAVARQARAEAFTAALGAFLAPPTPEAPPPEPELELVAVWGVDRLHDAIADVHDELRSTGHTVPSLPSAGQRATVAQTRAGLRDALAAVDGERGGWPVGLKTVDAAQLTLDDLGSALVVADADPDALAHCVATFRLPRGATVLKSDACDALRAAVADVVQARTDAEAIVVHGHLDRLLGLYAAAYADAKRARSAVDYDDLELLTNDLLGSAPAVAAALRERFARIMVDEFQDTNPLQLQLLSHLDSGNVFLVGDALQSIYGFRHADVAVFRAQRRRHEALGAAPALATNWRSQPELLQTLNAAFGPLHEDYVPLVAGKAQPEDRPAVARVQLLLVDDAHDDEGRLPERARHALQTGMPPARSMTVLAEARAVAAHVAGLVADGACGAGEVAILLRAASDLHVFERALELEGLATLASGGRGYWLRQQVQDLTSYLAALANPMDEPALLAVLASPLVGLSSDGLALLAQTARERGRRLWGVVTHDAEGAGLGPADRAALTGFGSWFSVERAQAPLLALDALITRVVQRTGYDLHVLSLPGGRRRLANVHKLERLAAGFEESHGRDVRAFIDHVAAEVAAEAREPEAPVELGDLDAVQLMTIHAAKGLEFGVVVVAGLGRQGQAGVGPILVHGEQVGLRLPRLHAENVDALDFAALKARAQAAQVQEERRIMHVAFTRAESQLVISGGVTLGKDLPSERPGGAPLGWVGTCVDPTLPHRLSADAPELLVDRYVGDQRLQVLARLVTVPTDDGVDAVADVGEGADRGVDAVSVAGEGVPPASAPGPPPAPAGPVPAVEQLALTVVEPTAPGSPSRRGRGRRPGPHATRAPAGAPVPPPATLSYSSLADHAACGYRFYLRRTLGLPPQDPPPEPPVAAGGSPPPAPGLDPVKRGSIAHALLEAPDPSATTREDVRRAAEDEHVAVTEAEIDDLLALVDAFAATTVAARVAAARRARREEPFAFALDDHDPRSPLVTGFIDLVAVEEDGAWLVVDYKTNHAPDVDLPGYVDALYATQRRIYALAALRAGAPAVHVAYVFLERPDEPVISTHLAADAPALTAAVVAEADDVLHGRFPVAAHPHRDLCLTCPGRGGMCSWPEAMSLRPPPAGVNAW